MRRNGRRWATGRDRVAKFPGIVTQIFFLDHGSLGLKSLSGEFTVTWDEVSSTRLFTARLIVGTSGCRTDPRLGRNTTIEGTGDMKYFGWCLRWGFFGGRGCLIAVAIGGIAVAIAEAGQRDSNTENALAIRDEDAPEELAGWIEQLGHGSLTKRRQAKAALIQADAAAVPLLARAALSDQRDVVTYSMEVLATLKNSSPSVDTRRGAMITLQWLAESPTAGTAERAKQILGLVAGDQQAEPAVPDVLAPANPNAGMAMNRNVAISTADGMRTLRIDDGGRTTLVQEQPRGRIRVTIHENGKKKEFVARNLADLKKKEPDIYALYEAYASQNSGADVAQNFPGNFSGGTFSGGFAGGFVGGPQGFRTFGTNNFQNGQFQPFGAALGEQAMFPPAGDQPGMQERRLAADPGVMNPPIPDRNGQVNAIAQLEELKHRLADQPTMVQLLEQQIRALKGE